MHRHPGDPDYAPTALDRFLERHAGAVMLASIVPLLILLALMPGEW